MLINNGEYNNERFNLFKPDKSFFFVDFTVGPSWTGKNVEKYRNRSYDGGITFNSNAYVDQMFGAYFFLSEDIVIHS